MSPKDLMTIGFIDKIIAAGVSVLKLEGRGRSADYVKTITAAYKEAVQSVKEGTYTKEKIEQWESRLAGVFNRGFWDGYYMGKKIGEWSEVYGSQATQKKTYIGKLTNYFTKLQVAEVLLEAGSLSVDDKIIINVARLTSQKKIDRLIRACAKINMIENNYKLIILGQGNLKEKLQKQITQIIIFSINSINCIELDMKKQSIK
jgi:glycogen synthase